jgi:hypothetical protein
MILDNATSLDRIIAGGVDCGRQRYQRLIAGGGETSFIGGRAPPVNW